MMRPPPTPDSNFAKALEKKKGFFEGMSPQEKFKFATGIGDMVRSAYGAPPAPGSDALSTIGMQLGKKLKQKRLSSITSGLNKNEEEE